MFSEFKEQNLSSKDPNFGILWVVLAAQAGMWCEESIGTVAVVQRGISQLKALVWVKKIDIWFEKYFYSQMYMEKKGRVISR